MGTYNEYPSKNTPQCVAFWSFSTKQYSMAGYGNSSTIPLDAGFGYPFYYGTKCTELLQVQL